MKRTRLRALKALCPCRDVLKANGIRVRQSLFILRIRSKSTGISLEASDDILAPEKQILKYFCGLKYSESEKTLEQDNGKMNGRLSFRVLDKGTSPTLNEMTP